MPYFPIVDLNSIGPLDPEGKAVANILTIEDDDREVLPVFTSIDRFWAFADKRFAGDDFVRPSTYPIDPFRLADMLRELRETGLDAVVFNPIALSGNEWRSAVKPIPVANYCRFASEIRPGIAKLAKEAEARFGHLPVQEALREAMKRNQLRIEEVVRNTAARIAEWEVTDDSPYGEGFKQGR